MTTLKEREGERGPGFAARFAAIDRKFAWSFLGFVLTGVSLALAVWFFMNSSPGIPSLKFAIVADSKVVQVSKRLPDLKVLFRGSDILDSEQNLSVITLRIENDGQADILEGGFDSTIPWGAKFDKSTIVSATVEGATSSYLRDRFKVRITAPDRLEFDKVILEHGNSVDLSVLVLNNAKNEVSVVATGKVAGIKEMRVVRADSQTPKLIQSALWYRSGLLYLFFVASILVYLILAVLLTNRLRRLYR